MHWYEGNIAEAITISKSKGSIFVVYIEGKDAKSQQITTLIDNREIGEKLEGEAFVAIKIEAGSVPHQQFSQIYKETPVPSLYFIGKKGTPLEIITEADDVSSFSQTLLAIVEKAGLTLPSKPQDIKEATQNLIKEENASSNVVCENGVCTIRPSTSKEEIKAEITHEEKVENAKKLIEQKRQEKLKEEEKTERQKEIERRKVGQGVQKMRKWVEDEERKEMLEEREKEKREQKAARERVLAQIAQDKAERAARFSAAQSPPVSAPTPVQPPVSGARADSNVSRIQFRLPDGRTTTNDFASTDTLQTVHNYVNSNLNMSSGHYVLATSFPRREFTAEDNLRTLAELELIPTAVLLVLPLNKGTVSTNPGGLSSMIWSIFTPIFSLFTYLRSFVFGTSGRDAPSTSADEGGSKRPATDNLLSGQAKRRSAGTVVRRHGNIHRLTDAKDSDDENNTWNGNSTQQM